MALNGHVLRDLNDGRLIDITFMHDHTYNLTSYA